MSVTNLIDFDWNLGKESQNFCSKSPSPNILSRLVVGVVIKDVARIYDIAIHIIIGLGKLAICTTKIPYSIPARLCGSTPNYNIVKEGFAHLGFSGYYFADMFISLTNIINRYPKDKMEKVETFFSKFLLSFRKDVANKEERSQKQTQEELQESFSEEKARYSVNHPPEVAEEMAKISAESHPKLFSMLYAEHIENNEGQKKIQQKATVYARNCIRIYSAMYQKFLKECSEKETEEQALLYAKIYVNAHLRKLARQPKTQSKEESEKQADIYAKYFTELFFSEYQRCLKNTPEAKQQAMTFAEEYIEIFYKACTFPPETPKEKAKEIKDSLFKEYIHKIPEIIKTEINIEFYFTPYIRKYVECQADGRRRSAKKIAARYAERLTQKITPEIVDKFNKTRMNSVLHKKKTNMA